ncbi:bacillithiol biosynthesis cysteine-adding enzyme BshC [Pseudalkalibacillus sp. Hm43]|uniref:bacillithiol biosynthesis cysteine-adding enzyme BshC n=1 Tax=Pseudalkalibacillus sp. Hm43 TaxID=3450742 RepID=UPI003F442AFD
MNVLDIPYQHKNDLYSAYLSGDANVLGLFDYDPTSEQSYIDRWKELKERHFPREAVYGHLMDYHRKLPASEHTYSNIERIKDPETTVVVTGQQAGLLTGPLYTIHKCMSAILFAKEKEKQLGTPVVPVFWVAGEDHDFDEVNHIHVPEQSMVRKKKLSLSEGKRSVSYIQLQKEQMHRWIDEVIRSFGEKEHTNELKSMMEAVIEHTSSMTDFFSYLMLTLFKDYGIVMLDSNHPEIRKIETPYFLEMIKQNRETDHAFQEGMEEVSELGYSTIIESEEANSHLFIDEGDTRVLLIREDGQFRGKHNECLYTIEEMREIAKQTPERFSNNVVTRPLMQDLLLPTLAFVAGPGEISYWSMLRKTFHTYDIQMPPIIPRLSISVIDRTTKKLMDDTGLSLEMIQQSDVSSVKEEWLKEHTDYDLDEEFTTSLHHLKKEHERLEEIAVDLDKGLQPIVEKNWEIIEGQISYLKQKMEHSIYQRHEIEMRKYDYLFTHISPHGQPQERVLNVFYYINHCGMGLIDTLMSGQYEWNGNPKAVYV